MLSPEVAKHYIVVEVALYPQDGRNFDVNRLDFALRNGDRTLRASKPLDVASPWSENHSPLNRRAGPSVETETGVFVGHGTDPVTGRPRTDVATWEGVGVSNYPNNPPPPPSGPDPAIEDRIRRTALPSGPTSVPVAGYLYFGLNGKRHDSLTLNYSNDDGYVALTFPK